MKDKRQKFIDSYYEIIIDLRKDWISGIEVGPCPFPLKLPFISSVKGAIKIAKPRINAGYVVAIQRYKDEFTMEDMK